MLPHQMDSVLRHGLFRGVDHGRIRSLLEPLSVRCDRPGETVAEPSLPRSALHLMLSGRCQAFDATSAGRRIILDYVQPGGIDGFLALAALRDGDLTPAAAGPARRRGGRTRGKTAPPADLRGRP